MGDNQPILDDGSFVGKPRTMEGRSASIVEIAIAVFVLLSPELAQLMN